jgi:hypothetical protein
VTTRVLTDGADPDGRVAYILVSLRAIDARGAQPSSA